MRKILKPLSRRTALKAAGISIGLPLLEAMAPIGKTAFAQDQKPLRFMPVFIPQGFVQDYFIPDGIGKNYSLSPTLQGLAPIKDDVLLLKNVYSHAQNPVPVGGAHAHGTGCFLTGVKIPRSGLKHAVSVDQVIADISARQTPIRSLHLAADPLTRNASAKCDVAGQGCAFTHHISWSSNGNYIPNITNPAKAFSMIYGAVGGGAEGAESSAADRSILDFVMAEANKLQGQLGRADQLRLDEYLYSIRQVEARLGGGKQGGNGAAVCENPDAPEDMNLNPDTSGAVAQVQIDLLAEMALLAFQCDATRVATLMYGRGASSRRFDDILDVPSATHHSMAHHGGKASTIEHLRKIEAWEIERFATMVAKMKAATDPDGSSLLDSSLIFASSEINEGAKHRYQNMPFMIAGSANGKLKTGQCIALPDNRNDFCHLYETFIDVMGRPDYGKFGSYGGGKISDILA